MPTNPITITAICHNSNEASFISHTKDIWLALFAKSEQNYFLSWPWIATWLGDLNCELTFLHASINDKSVGCGFIVNANSFGLKNGLFPKQAYLHRTGSVAQDQMWIEYNDFLLDKKHADAVRIALVKHVLNNSYCQSLHIGISKTNTIQSICETENIAYLPLSESKTYKKILNKSDDSFDALIANFSKNTKSQIRRSVKLLQQSGEYSLEVAQSAEQALTWFNEAGAIHQALWRDTAFGSGFDNPHFVNFHQKIIQQGFEHHTVVLSRLVVNQHVSGYIYGFIHEHTFYFYLSAFEKDSNPKIKLGVLAHVEMMLYLAQKGITQYDFLAGTARYKSSLSDQQDKMGFYRLTANNMLFTIDSKLRALKLKLKHKSTSQ